jgi:hypothetical protein
VKRVRWWCKNGSGWREMLDEEEEEEEEEEEKTKSEFDGLDG